jgi:hypothetical protein
MLTDTATAANSTQNFDRVNFSLYTPSGGPEPEAEDGPKTIRGNAIGADRWALLVATAAKDAAADAANAAAEVISSLTEDSADSDENNPTTQQGDPLTANQIQCLPRVMDPPPPAGDPLWEGNDPATGSVLFNDCSGQTVYEFMPGPNPILASVAPPSAEELAARAYREIYIAAPVLNFGPDRTKLSVNLWTWLWTNDLGPQTITVAAGGVSVTATATLASVTWSLGEPAPTGGPYAPGPPVTITCEGTGTATPPNYDWKAEPPCGHKYTWMSTKERTGGLGKWPVTATSNWTVTWQSNTGVSGSGELSATGNDALEIGEYRTVLVQGPGG